MVKKFINPEHVGTIISPGIERIGENYLHEFLKERDWACIIKLPSIPSNRSCYVIRKLEWILPEMDEAESGRLLSPRVAFLNYGYQDRGPLNNNSFDGEPVRIQLYVNGDLKVETDDSILWKPLRIMDGGFVDELGNPVIDGNGIYVGPVGRNIQSPAQALKEWIFENGISPLPLPQDRRLWEARRNAYFDDAASVLADLGLT